jgi:hypothetical protein
LTHHRELSARLRVIDSPCWAYPHDQLTGGAIRYTIDGPRIVHRSTGELLWLTYL